MIHSALEEVDDGRYVPRTSHTRLPSEKDTAAGILKYSHRMLGSRVSAYVLPA